MDKVSYDYIKSLGGFKNELPYVVDIMVKSIPKDVPRSLALSIVLSETSSFIGAFRNSILLNTESKRIKTLVPTNTFIFGLAPSGISKDRTKNTISKLMQGGYDGLNESIKAELKTNAKAVAIAEGDEEANYYKYMEEPIDQEFKFGTVAGVSTEISEIGNKQSLGCPTLVSSEIGSDLATRGEELIKTFTILSDLYDLGTAKFDTIKSKELKLRPVTSLPVNFLVFGSEKGILMDKGNKAKFKGFFNQQLARRCLFSFTQYTEDKVREGNVEDRLKAKSKATVSAGIHFDEIFEIFEELGVVLPRNNELLVNPEVDDVFNMYLDYNDVLSDEMPDTLPMSKLARKHKQWLALKLSGIYALLENKTMIEVEDYIAAINTVEMLSPDLEAFEVELDKESYELLDSYCEKNTTDGSFSISLHELKKMKFIEGTSGAEGKLRELTVLLNDYSTKGIYSIEGSSLHFEETIDTELVGVSVLEVDNSAIEEATATNKSKATLSGLKQAVAETTVYGYTFNEAAFEDYGELLGEDFAYTPFKLKDASIATYDKDKHPTAKGGVRGRDNIASGAKFVVLDVDTSTITDEEAHLMLEDVNHHIARTSDKDNAFKFRVLIEMDMVVNIDSVAWKYFIKLLGTHVGLNIDPVAQSQIFFAYKDRNVLSVTDAEPMKVKHLVVSALEQKENSAASKPVSKPQMKAKLENPRDTFRYAFEHPTETGVSTVLMRAAYHARDLGGTREYVLQLMDTIQKYVDFPLEEQRYQQTVISQISRW